MSKSLLLGPSGVVALAGDIQIRVDIHTCLYGAIAEQFGISRDEITPKLKPSEDPIGALEVGWGMCLKNYEGRMKALRPL
ncbi:hypothetical protein [Sphingomonas glaciei]|uniref:Uncharacterized protein n=1 Tax=Sphingomonas glaciei TaxID=2938948 RepID=A0ABY5N0R4_9SPHN|nr:hypothetical protein [Sphingomonas glaciei]UUR08898.1 hypothetical protein M1K48_04515 [Sphingomonas glaciei]